MGFIQYTLQSPYCTIHRIPLSPYCILHRTPLSHFCSLHHICIYMCVVYTYTPYVAWLDFMVDYLVKLKQCYILLAIVAIFIPYCTLHRTPFSPYCTVHRTPFSPYCTLHLTSFSPDCTLHRTPFIPYCTLHSTHPSFLNVHYTEHTLNFLQNTQNTIYIPYCTLHSTHHSFMTLH